MTAARGRRLTAAALLLFAAARLIATPPPAGGATHDSELFEVFFRLEAGVRTRRLDADLRAGGRLLMRRQPTPDGGFELTLVRSLEAPWKLYWVNPAGPFGEELKLAAVVTLPAATWESLAEERREVAALGVREHTAWQGQTGGVRALDATFAFVVIGPAAGRFQATFADHGGLSSVANRLTERWLGGPFDRFIGTWGPEIQRPTDAPEGYWFWNHGEREPFAYEPHTYHALAKALLLLAERWPAGAQGTMDWTDPAAAAAAVAETLAPRIRGQFGSAGSLSARITSHPSADAATSRTATAADKGAGLRLVREALFPVSGPPASDVVRVELERDKARLQIEVGYHPAKQVPGS